MATASNSAKYKFDRNADVSAMSLAARLRRVRAMYDQEMKLMAYYEFKRIENAIQTYQSSKQTNGDKIGAECKKKTQEEVDDDGLSSAGSDRAQQMEESGADAAEEVKPKEEQKEETSKTIEQGDIGGREADGDGEVVGKEEEVEEEKRNEIDISQLTDDAVSEALVLIDSWGPFVDALKETGQEVEKMINSALDDEGWNVGRDVGNQRTLFKMDDDGHHLKLKGTIAAPAFNIIACIAEVDLWTLWMPFLKEAQELLFLSEFVRVIRMKLSFPPPIWPFISNRDMVLHAYGVDDYDRSGLLLGMARDPTDSEYQRWKKLNGFVPPPPGEEGFVRVKVRYGGVICKPIDSRHTEVVILAAFDVNMALPDWLISTMTGNFAHLFLDLLQKHASNLSDEYKKRISTNQTLYKNIIDRLSELDASLKPDEAAIAPPPQRQGWFW